MKAITPYRVMAACGFLLAVVVFAIGQTGTTSDGVYATWIVLIVVGLGIAGLGMKLDDRERKRRLDEERRRRLGLEPRR
jgi:hypothetical protein